MDKKIKRKDIPTKSVLIACHEFHKNKEDAPWRQLVKKFNAPEKVVYAAMERDYDKGLLEYGVSLRTAWVTDEGYKWLQENG